MSEHGFLDAHCKPVRLYIHRDEEGYDSLPRLVFEDGSTASGPLVDRDSQEWDLPSWGFRKLERVVTATSLWLPDAARPDFDEEVSRKLACEQELAWETIDLAERREALLQDWHRLPEKLQEQYDHYLKAFLTDKPIWMGTRSRSGWSLMADIIEDHRRANQDQEIKTTREVSSSSPFAILASLKRS